MTTLAAARTALVTAVGASDDYVDPPGCMVFSDGADLATLYGDGSLTWRWRVTCYVGYKADNAAIDVELLAYVAAKTLILLADPVWGITGVTAATIRSLAGGDHLAADISVFTRVTLA